jgi:circadian clock protein KaiB
MSAAEAIPDLPEGHFAAGQTGWYSFILFVAGASEMSVRAISDVRRLCEAHFVGRYTLEVVDVHRDPERMLKQHVLAAPTLIKDSPSPARRLVGDLSDTAHVLAALGIAAVDSPAGRRSA